MYKTRLAALIGLAVIAQGAMASTIWLKDQSNHVCYNTLSTNVDHVMGLGGINKDGTGYTLTISNPTGGTVTITKPTGAPGEVLTPATGECATIPKSDTNLEFTGGVVANNVAISRIGTGPSDTGQCLEQGITLAGVTGSSSVTESGSTWTLSLSYAGTPGCKLGTDAPPSGPLQRSATLAIDNSNVYSGSYHIFNVNSVPEPSTTLLLLAGALGLGSLAFWRRRNEMTQKMN